MERQRETEVDYRDCGDRRWRDRERPKETKETVEMGDIDCGDGRYMQI